MRISIEIDDALLSSAMTAAGLPTKKATIEEGLRMLVQINRQVEALNDLKGLGWTGELSSMRSARRTTRR